MVIFSAVIRTDEMGGRYRKLEVRGQARDGAQLKKIHLFFSQFEKTTVLLIFKSIMEKAMKTGILFGESESDLKLIIEIAHKLGIKTKVLTQEDVEDLAMIYAIEKEKTRGYVDTLKFIKSLRC